MQKTCHPESQALFYGGQICQKQDNWVFCLFVCLFVFCLFVCCCCYCFVFALFLGVFGFFVCLFLVFLLGFFVVFLLVFFFFAVAVP